MKGARTPAGSGGIPSHLLLTQIRSSVSKSASPIVDASYGIRQSSGSENMPPIVGIILRDPAEFRFRKCATYCWHKKATIKSFIWQLVGLIIILFFIQFDLLLIWETLPQFMDVLWHSGRSQALL